MLGSEHYSGEFQKEEAPVTPNRELFAAFQRDTFRYQLQMQDQRQVEKQGLEWLSFVQPPREDPNLRVGSKTRFDLN